MGKGNVLTAVVLDKRRVLKDGRFPVKLRVTFNRKQKLYGTKFDLTNAEFDSVMGTNPKGQAKMIRMALDSLEREAIQVAETLKVFEFEAFTKRLFGEGPSGLDVYRYYESVISKMEGEERLGTASNYRCSMESLKGFRSSLLFTEITVDFLQSYEKWLLGKGRSISTVGIYLRPLRAILNMAINEGILTKDFIYPFGLKSKFRYQIPASRNIKKALDNQELKAIFSFTPGAGTWEEKALDFWKFSYLANGMNMKDIAHLTYGDLDSGYIRFIRAKSKNTTGLVSPITVHLTEDMKKIVEKWGSPAKDPKSRIFSICSQQDDLKKQRADLQQFIKMVNKYMKRIALSLGVEKPVTTYAARHTFSTKLKRSGVDIQEISEALGHSSILTTRAYLDSFDWAKKKDISKLLTEFD